MSNIGETIAEEAEERGRRKEVFKSVQDGDYSARRGAEKLGLTEEEFEREMEKARYVKESTTRYIDALQVVLQGRYPGDSFCLAGYRECAVCLERNGASWVVYSGERGNHYDEMQCDTVLMACLQIMRKMSNNVEEISALEREFIDMLCKGG